MHLNMKYVLLMLAIIGVPANSVAQLSVTEELISREVRRLGGDWESGSHPALVRFSGNKFESRHFEMLGHLPTLRWFVAEDCALDNVAVAYLGRVNQLERLDIKSCKIEPKCFLLLRDNRELKKIYFESIDVSAQLCFEVANIPNLESVWIEKCKFTEKTAHSLKELQSLKEMKELTISGCEGIDDAIINSLRRLMPKVKVH